MLKTPYFGYVPENHTKQDKLPEKEGKFELLAEKKRCAKWGEWYMNTDGEMILHTCNIPTLGKYYIYRKS